MAIFGISLYGLDKYGPGSSSVGPGAFDSRSIVDYAVDPFTADALDYESITLSWSSPKGNWTEFRLVKNWLGFPVTESDGLVLVDTTSATSGYHDTFVKPGEWHYYGLWVKSAAGPWVRAAVACTLMLKDFGYGDALFDNLPGHHRLLQGHMDDLPVVENDDLKRFLQVLGMGLNYIKTYYDSMQFLHDPMKARSHQLLAMASELGVEYSPAMPAQLYRQHVLNAAVLGREKGTPEEIRSAASLVTGWDIDIITGPNLMLNEDQASFVHPQYDLWDAGVNYPAGSRVAYNGFLYTTNSTGAYGNAQAPTGTGASNTWWTILSNLIDGTLRASDGSFAGWTPVNYSGGAAPADAVSVGVGIQSPTDPTVSWANALVIKNTGTTTADLGARSAGGDFTKPEDAVLRGTPVPRPVPWDPTAHYEIGAVVSYNRVTYVAERMSQGVQPDTSTLFWSTVSTFDQRAALVVSAHVKGVDAASQALVAYPVVDVFDVHGVRLGTIDGSLVGTQVYDALTGRPGTLAARSTDTGSKTWAVSSGTWTTASGTGVFTSGPGLATVTGNANGQVSVTLQGSAPSLSQALVFRGTDSTHYLKATRTGLYTVNGGTVTLLGNYSTALGEGDRLTATFNGSAITILRNGVGVLSVTSAYNSTGTMHGTLVE